jgi:hypothetical protein
MRRHYLSEVPDEILAADETRKLPAATSEACLAIVLSVIFEVVYQRGAGSQRLGPSMLLRARGSDSSSYARGSCGRQPPSGWSMARQARMLTKTQDNEEIIARVATLDIGNAEQVASLIKRRGDISKFLELICSQH